MITTSSNITPSRRAVLGGAAALAGGAAAGGVLAAAPPATLLNVSYDPTRELYKAYDAWFAADWKKKTGQDVSIQQSHGGSGKQAASVINGLQADVVTLALAADIDAIAEKAHLLPGAWQSRLPDNSTPYTSVIVFLVRKGNPKGIRDWGDLVKPGVQVIQANPKTSGGARWSYLAAYAWALKHKGGEGGARAYLKDLFAHIPVLDSGSRGSTTTFAQRGLGDVLLSFENEAWLAQQEIGADKVEIVIPPTSILAEPPVALIDKVVDRRHTRPIAEAYLRGLYGDFAQDLIGKNYYRPRNPAALAKYAHQFPKIPLSTIGDLGGWTKVQKVHFDDGGVFDQIYAPHG
jgi:sulfate transport system substrate-binding protein